MQEQWNVTWAPEDLVTLMENGTLDPLIIKLTSSAALAEESRRFIEDNLREM